MLAPVEIWEGAATAGSGGFVRDGSAGLGRTVLPAPSPARARLRRFFDPRSGWFRNLERTTNHLLSRHLYPRIPWIDLPYSLQLERHLTVSEATLAVSGLAEGLSGLRVLLITDVHAGPFLKPRVLERVFEKLLSLHPDLVLLGGDVATSRTDEIEPFAAALRMLRAPLGAFAVLGNHDYYTGDPGFVARAVEAAGLRLLRNASVVVERGGGRLILAGVDDLHSGRPDLDAALAAARRWGGPGSRPPVLLLSHNPDLFFEAARAGVAVVLSGHTHGGQIRIPRLPVIARQSRYRLDEGRYAADGAELVVSRGLGVTGMPVRVQCPPEAVLLHLVPAG